MAARWIIPTHVRLPTTGNTNLEYRTRYFEDEDPQALQDAMNIALAITPFTHDVPAFLVSTQFGQYQKKKPKKLIHTAWVVYGTLGEA